MKKLSTFFLFFFLNHTLLAKKIDQCFKEAWSSEVYVELSCADNIHRLLKKCWIDQNLSNTKVLYILRDKGGSHKPAHLVSDLNFMRGYKLPWYYHVVLLHEDTIYDFDYTKTHFEYVKKQEEKT